MTTSRSSADGPEPESSVCDVIRDWDGVGIITHFDRPTGAWFFVALHDDTLGTPAGGTRMKVYPSTADAVRDAMRLAEGMTRKWAAIEFGQGGGKAVLSMPGPLEGSEREAFFRRYGRFLESLHGCFSTGQDLGTRPQDVLAAARETSYVHGTNVERNEVRDTGPVTALGVLGSIRAVLRHTRRTDDLEGVRVHVEGLGNVGASLARMLASGGASLLLSDVNGETARSVSTELGGELVDPQPDGFPDCDIYAPCAVGGRLNEETIPLLRCDAIVGSANNQLAVPEDGDRLHERGIVYAPDFVVNAGAAVALMMLSAGESEAAIEARIDQIPAVLERILQASEEGGEPPARAAERHVEQVLARARARQSK